MNPVPVAWLSLPELRRRHSYKWRAYPPDILPAFVAEMDIQLAPPVAGALATAIADGDTGYAARDPELAQAAAAFQAARFGWGPDQAGVTFIPDVMAGVAEVLRRAVPPGSGVVINTPIYPPFFNHIREVGCQVVEAPLARDGAGYSLDLDVVEAAFAAGARAYLLCNPHNPTGLVLGPDELRRVAELSERFDVLVLADEIHGPLTLPGARHVPYLSLPEARDRGVTFVSASKAWNIPGLKCAHTMTASTPMRALISRLPDDIAFRAGNLGLIASRAAYEVGAPWLDQVLDLIDGNRRLMARLLAERIPEIGYVAPRGTYLAWLDCTRLELAVEPAEVFRKRGRVALGRGSAFGLQSRDFVRVTLATDPAILTEIVGRMRAALD